MHYLNGGNAAECYTVTQFLSQSLSFTLCSILKKAKYLLVGHKFDGSLWGNLQDIDTISSPQRCRTSFFQHLLKTTNQADFVALGGMHLYIKKQSVTMLKGQCIYIVLKLAYEMH